eukprot:1013266-Rhodomonas_salina.1
MHRATPCSTVTGEPEMARSLQVLLLPCVSTIKCSTASDYGSSAFHKSALPRQGNCVPNSFQVGTNQMKCLSGANAGDFAPLRWKFRKKSRFEFSISESADFCSPASASGIPGNYSTTTITKQSSIRIEYLYHEQTFRRSPVMDRAREFFGRNPQLKYADIQIPGTSQFVQSLVSGFSLVVAVTIRPACCTSVKKTQTVVAPRRSGPCQGVSAKKNLRKKERRQKLVPNHNWRLRVHT